MSKFQEIEINIYRQGNPDRIAMCPLQVTPDPSEEQSLLEYNQEDICQSITAVIDADGRGMISEVVVQNPFTNEETWEVLFTDGERGVYLIEYE